MDGGFAENYEVFNGEEEEGYEEYEEEYAKEQTQQQFSSERRIESFGNVDGSSGNDMGNEYHRRDSSSGKLFVGGVSWETTEATFTSYFCKYGEITDSVIMMDKLTGRSRDELKEYFSSYGSVAEYQVMIDRDTGRSRGFGFVTFENEDAVERIFSDGRTHELGGKQVEIKKAVPKRAGGDFTYDARTRHGGSASRSYGDFGRGSADYGSGGGYSGKMGRGCDNYDGGYGSYGGNYGGGASGSYGGYGYGFGFWGPMYGGSGYGGGGYGGGKAYGGGAGGYGGGRGYSGGGGGGYGGGRGYGGGGKGYGVGDGSSGFGGSKGYGNGGAASGRVVQIVVLDHILATIHDYGADEMPVRIGFLGLGIMGSPMAQNLIKAGCDLTVWNRTKNKCDPLISLGAKYKSCPREVAESCDVTFAMLADPESAVDVACGELGAARGMSPGKGYVDVSTVDGATSKLISEHVKATGALFLEAPVSGSKKPAEDGQLIFLTAGDKPLFELAAPFLDIMGKERMERGSRFFLGDVGNGAAMKLVVNMIMGSEKVGLDPSVLVEVVSQGAISAPMFSLKGPSMVQSLYPTAFPLKHQQKDLRLALGLAESVSQPTPIAAAANEMYKVAKSRGLSDQDFSAVIEALKVKLQNQSD
ncbi:glyoxylate reductase 2 [Actinidia rufa]|uniref:Glyoxylate reductase 2 n=2 Tax=Magnoliopsida TaxID=3398 RepID=A0A7J0GBD4_9ERIC|nr:glyoxylate reductase 2 [Actinidia rufa]